MSLISAPQLLRTSPNWSPTWQSVHASLVKPIELIRAIDEQSYATWAKAAKLEQIYPDDRTEKNKLDLARVTRILAEVAERGTARHSSNNSRGLAEYYNTLHSPWLSIPALLAIRAEAITVDKEVLATLSKIQGVAHETWKAGNEIRSHAGLVLFALTSFDISTTLPICRAHALNEIRTYVVEKSLGFDKQISLLEKLMQAMTEERDTSFPPLDVVQVGDIPATKTELTASINEEAIARNLAGGEIEPSPQVKPKPSTQKGDAETKLISRLTAYHRYVEGIGGLNMDHIGNNELARMATVDKASASAFFKKHFKSHAKYKATCRDPKALYIALKLLNGEYPPHELAAAYDETRALINAQRNEHRD
jgi:hypothetical protein